ncbi:TAXI family TRAP transporter solute-binding subunit [Ramlibacter albus]|uniref:TAXI family TRAP transporter solute-binding subunit n=1 Tax=Ramlibacter albus TaxID=2079448 RepID=A0A923S3R7_9BURK|nr:TAXI family TRAP transporter solute-binding subunit [Ramlibacter albus]MBC5766730.1 TAXI family TRAP transporter solute-binding subunit [Ramlibacter albus]
MAIHRTLATCLVACAALLATACSTPAPPPTLAQVGIYAAGSGSVFLPYAQGIASHLTAAGLKAAPVETTGSVENARRINADPQGMALVLMSTAHEAYTGQAAWTQGVKHDNLRALFPMYEAAYQAVALRSSGITNMSSLRGKRVGVGPSGGPSEVYFKGFAAAVGLDFVPINGTPAELAASVIAGRIDAMFQGGAIPVPGIKTVADAADAVVFGFSGDEVAAVRRVFPYLGESAVPPGTYKGQATALRSVSAWNFALVHKDFPEADAYWITRTVLSVADPTALHALAGPTRAANAVHNTSVPFHPGALKYYQQQGVAGLK